MTLKFNLSFDGPGDEEYESLIKALREAGQEYPHSFLVDTLTYGPVTWQHSMVEFTLTHIKEGTFTLAFNNLVA